MKIVQKFQLVWAAAAYFMNMGQDAVTTECVLESLCWPSVCFQDGARTTQHGGGVRNKDVVGQSGG